MYKILAKQEVLRSGNIEMSRPGGGGGSALERAVKLVVVSYAERAWLSTPGSVLSAHTVRTLDDVCAALGGHFVERLLWKTEFLVDLSS